LSTSWPCLDILWKPHPSNLLDIFHPCCLKPMPPPPGDCKVEKLEVKVAGIEARLQNKFNSRFDKLEAKFDSLLQRRDQHVSSVAAAQRRVDALMDGTRKRCATWLVGLCGHSKGPVVCVHRSLPKGTRCKTSNEMSPWQVSWLAFDNRGLEPQLW